MNFFRECCILLQYGHSLSTRAAAFAVISRSSPGGSAAADDFLLIRNSFQKTCSPFCTFGRQFGICPGICAVFYWQFVTAQYPHSYEQKSISNRLRRWDFCLQACVLLRSAQQVRRPTEQLPVFFLFYFLYLRDLSLFSLTEKSGPGHSQILSQIRLPISVVPTCFMPSSMISTVR